MKNKNIYAFIFALSFIFIGISSVNAATDSLYTYDKTSLDFADNKYIVSRSDNIFTLTNETKTVTINLSDPTVLPAYDGYKIKSIKNIMIYGTTNEIEIYIIPAQIMNVSTGQIYSDFQYTAGNVPAINTFSLWMSNSSYTSRRTLYFDNNVTISGYPNYLKAAWRYSYSIATSSYTMVGSYPRTPAQINIVLVEGGYASVPIYYTDFHIQSCNSSTCILFYKSDYIDDAEQLPSYLKDYKRVDFDSRYKFMFISNISSGLVYVSTENYVKYRPIVNYYDLSLENQPYSSILPLWVGTIDGKYYKIKYDLSEYAGADFISLTKYDENFINDTSDIAYYVYVPKDAYVSMSRPVAVGDGNTIDFDYMDETGNIQNGNITNGDITDKSNSTVGFIGTIKYYISNIFDGFMPFYNNLNDEIKLAIISVLPLVLLCIFIERLRK